MEATNRLEFCISCHEMRDNVYKSIRKQSITRTGPACAPFVLTVMCQGLGHKVLRKIQASEEVFEKIVGWVDTPEKFEAHRMEMLLPSGIA